MAKKILFLLVLLGFCIPSFAGEYENAVNSGLPVFLYLYTPYCGYCRRFDSIYEKLKTANKDLKFVRINAETAYGTKLMYQYKARYVPYVVLINSKKNFVNTVEPDCLMNYICSNRTTREFIKL